MLRHLLIWVGVRLAALGLVVAMIYPAIDAAFWVNNVASAWAGPAAICSLVVAALSGVSSFWVKRHAWLLIAPVSFTIMFSATLAMIRDWMTQAETLLTVVPIILLGLVIVVIVWAATKTARVNHSFSQAVRELGEAVLSDSLFSDDGERIMIYPNQRRLLIRALISPILLSPFIGAFLWAQANAPDRLFLSVTGLLLIGIFTLLAVLNFIRLITRSPTLIVGPDGIYDNGSCIVTGRGLLRWNEILRVFVDTQKKSISTYHNLGIIVADVRAIRARQPLWKRPLILLLGQMSPISIDIGQSLLDRPTDEIVEQIKTYARLHAPTGSWHAITGAIPPPPDEP